MIWDGYWPSCTHGDFLEFQIGAHNGAYKGRMHRVVQFIGKNSGTLIARQRRTWVQGWYSVQGEATAAVISQRQVGGCKYFFFASFLHFFCTCTALCPITAICTLLMFVTWSEVAKVVEFAKDEDEDREPNLLGSGSDMHDDEPRAKKTKLSLNYGAKTTPASRAWQYPPCTFEPRSDCMWCVACQNLVDYKRKCVAGAHMKAPKHQAKANRKKKEKQPIETTQQGWCRMF